MAIFSQIGIDRREKLIQPSLCAGSGTRRNDGEVQVEGWKVEEGEVLVVGAEAGLGVSHFLPALPSTRTRQLWRKSHDPRDFQTRSSDAPQATRGLFPANIKHTQPTCREH